MLEISWNIYSGAIGLLWMLSGTVCNGQLLEGLYCGKDNCYEVLNVTRESTRNEVQKAYRQLARRFHPDLHRGDVAKMEAETKFKEIATAYEILRDEEARQDYDYMLDNPSAYYAHYYRYYRRRVAPKVDVRVVLVVTISIISIIQYYSLWQRYDTAIKYFMTVPKYRNKALEIIATQEKTGCDTNKKHGKGRVKMSKAEQREELDRNIRSVIEEKMDIKGAYAKPKITDILWLQLIFLPYTLAKYFVWQGRWIWKFTILRQEYGEEEQLYIIRKNMKMGQHQFDSIEDDQKQDYLDMQLWKREHFEEWKLEKEEEMKKSLAENARHKQYRRYMKNHGPSRMTFED